MEIVLPGHAERAGVTLAGDLILPPDPRGLIIFAHGSGSSRHSSRNRSVAAALQHAHLGTLLMDLLTEAEERTDIVSGHLRLDIPLLARRVAGAIDWAAAAEATSRLPIGLFGASTGAAAALIAAAERPALVRAVVSRGGRPDLADASLSRVKAPTLLIVGGRDEQVLQLNERAYQRLGAARSLQIVKGATHLFEEPGALEEVSTLAAEWFAGAFAE